eukprot:8700198-Pyramimonas_sp.AAC.1
MSAPSWMPERQRQRRVSSGCCIGRSCLMYSSWSKVTLPSSSLVYLTTQLVCVLVEFTLPKGVFYALDILVNGVLSAGHVDVINVFGREQVVARLELLVVGRGSDAQIS